MGALIIILFKKRKQPTWNLAVEYVLAILCLKIYMVRVFYSMFHEDLLYASTVLRT